jgi:hypothetical protein
MAVRKSRIGRSARACDGTSDGEGQSASGARGPFRGILPGTEERVRLAARAANDMTEGRVVETAGAGKAQVAIRCILHGPCERAA